MSKYYLLFLFFSFITLQSFKKEAITPVANGIELRASLLSNKLSINNEAVRLAITGYEKLKQLEGSAVKLSDQHIREWVGCGATIIGGCCGIGPKEISEVKP